MIDEGILLGALYNTTQTKLTCTSDGKLRVDAVATISGSVDISDKPTRQLGLVYGSQGEQLLQRAASFDLEVQLRTGGAEYDARQIRSLAKATDEVYGVLRTDAGVAYDGRDRSWNLGALDVPDLSDRPARQVGIIYGDVGQLAQKAASGDAYVQVRSGGAEIDPRSIRALVKATDEVYSALRTDAGVAYDARDRNWTITENLNRAWNLGALDVPDLSDRAARSVGRVDFPITNPVTSQLIGAATYGLGVGLFDACLTEDTLVYTNPRGPIAISELQQGDRIFACREDLMLEPVGVKDVWSTGVKDVYEVDVGGRRVKGTVNHPFLTLERISNSDWKRYEAVKVARERGLSFWEIERKGLASHSVAHVWSHGTKPHPWQYRLQWKRLDQLREGDLVGVSRKPLEGGHPYGLPEMSKETGFPKETDESLMWLIGLYLGDGSAPYGKVVFSVPATDGVRDALITALKSVGLSPAIYEREVVVHREQLRQLFYSLDLRGHANTKRLPKWVFNTPLEQRLALIAGYLDADGFIDKKARVVLKSCNKKLLEDVEKLAVTCGLVPTGLYPAGNGESGFGGGESWVLLLRGNVPTRNEVHKMRSRKLRVNILERFTALGIHLPKAFCGRDIGFAPVRSVKYVGKEKVYDISVEGEHCFLANGIVVHNSGNRMPSMDAAARPGYVDVIDRAARLVGTVSPVAASVWDVSDRAARLLGKVYGDQGVFTQRATSLDAQVQLRTAGTEYDARQIRALTSADVVDVSDKATRLLGVTYGSQAQQLLQRATSFDLQVQLRTAGTEYDARQIRALTSADAVDVSDRAARLLGTVSPVAASTWDVSDRAARLVGTVSPVAASVWDVSDRAARLLGIVYGESAQLQQGAPSDAYANPANALEALGFLMGWNSASWDRIRTVDALANAAAGAGVTLKNYHNDELGILPSVALGYDDTLNANAYRAVAVDASGRLEVVTV